MGYPLETGPQRVRDHLRRPVPGSRDLLTEDARNTVGETDPNGLSRLVGFAQRVQVGCKVVRGGECVGMAVTQRPAAPGQGVLVECARPLIVA